MAYRTQKVLLVFLGIPWLLLLGGCATFPTSEPVTLREQWLSYFKSCAPQDGAHSIQLFKDGNLMGAAELEWVARSDTDWEIELTNNLGQRLGRLVGTPQVAKNSDKNAGNIDPQDRIKLHSQSNLFKKLPTVEKEPDGFLVIDDHWIGLKAGEVSCVLAGHLPLGWAKNLMKGVEHADGIEMQFEDDQRTLTAVVKSLAAPQQIQICATSEWRSWLFFKHSVRWCTVKYKKSKAIVAKGNGLRGEYPYVNRIDITVERPSSYRMLLTPSDAAPPSSQVQKVPHVSRRIKSNSIYE